MTSQEALQTIIEKLTEAGLTVTRSPSGLNTINGVIPIRVEQESRGGLYSTRGNGKIRAKLGNYGRELIQYPQTKDGGFNWTKMIQDAKDLFAREEAARIQAEKNQQRRDRLGLEVDQLNSKYGVKDAFCRPARVAIDNNGLSFTARGLTKAQADVLMAKAMEMGLL
jgi:hypothetical protein